MIFSPNKSERFLAALRNYIHRTAFEGQKSSTKNDILRKIYKIEAVSKEYFPEPLDIGEYCFEQFKAARTIKLENNVIFKFSVDVKENFLIPIKPFEILIAEIIKTSDYIKIFTLNGNLIIAYHGDPQKPKPLIYKLNANVFFEHKSHTEYIIFPFDKTDKKSVYIKREWEILCDPFSVINLYLFLF